MAEWSREIVFDTETTGLDSSEDRIIEIGGVELVDRFPTGRTFHAYIDPGERRVHPEALAVHGISNEMLEGKPRFEAVADKFLAFFDGARFVAHNAQFDMGFVNAELARIGRPPIANDRVLDTLSLARRKNPMGPNTLDALCGRFGIDNSNREKHGALLDSELLAEVYIELIGGRQTSLGLDRGQVRTTRARVEHPGPRAHPLQPRIDAEGIEGHGDFWRDVLGEESGWARDARARAGVAPEGARSEGNAALRPSPARGRARKG